MKSYIALASLVASMLTFSSKSDFYITSKAGSGHLDFVYEEITAVTKGTDTGSSGTISTYLR